MIHQLYDIISIYMTGSLLLIAGGCFLFIPVPDNPLLGSYRKARMMMACAYFFFAAVNGVEYACRQAGSSDALLLTQTVTLAIAFSQAFLFTYTLISLLNAQWMERRRSCREPALVLAFVVAVFAAYFALPAAVARIVFYALTGLYSVQLIRYTRLFIANHRYFKQKMYNFFADGQERHLRWVVFSFCAALSIGALALLSALFMSHLGALLFSVVLPVFYAYFAVRFLRYGFSFRVIEPAMEEVEPVSGKEAEAVYPAAFASIEMKINRWVAAKGYTRQGVTLDALAAELCTNRCYLSSYLNNYKKQAFCNWIGALRIEEAKRLMLQCPDMNLQEIAQRTGFSHRSHFTHRFTKHTGLSPKFWRKKQSFVK